jgi:hypothetical protein
MKTFNEAAIKIFIFKVHAVFAFIKNAHFAMILVLSPSFDVGGSKTSGCQIYSVQLSVKMLLT